MNNIFSKIDINEGDTVLVSSDILRILINNNKFKNEISPDEIIDMLKDKIGKNGNLLFPTFNWDFCKGNDYHYKTTESFCGTLSNTALKRNDFLRTKNPIYSFAVTGKDMELISNLEHKDCFSLDSPFGYLINKKAKNLFIDLHYRLGGFPFVHVVEQEVGVNYRYIKNFTGFYTDKDKKKTKQTFSMYVRDLKKNIGATFISEKFDEILIKNNAFQKLKILNNSSEAQIINIKAAYDLLKKDLANNGDFIFSAKIDE